MAHLLRLGTVGLDLVSFCRCICCGSMLSLVQILFSIVFEYGNVG